MNILINDSELGKIIGLYVQEQLGVEWPTSVTFQLERANPPGPHDYIVSAIVEVENRLSARFEELLRTSSGDVPPPGAAAKDTDECDHEKAIPIVAVRSEARLVETPPRVLVDGAPFITAWCHGCGAVLLRRGDESEWCVPVTQFRKGGG